MSVILLTTGITDTKCLLVTHVSQSLPSVVNRKHIYPIRRETFLKRTSSLCVHGKAAGIQCWLTMVEQGKLPIPVLTGTAYTTEHGKQNKPWLKKRKLPGTRDRSHARPTFMWWRGIIMKSTHKHTNPDGLDSTKKAYSGYLATQQ